MAGTSSQFLQVPKVLPHRKSRSRSRSRPREVVAAPDTSVSSPKFRPQSPPMPAAEVVRKPTLNGFSVPEKMMNGHVAEKAAGNGYAVAPASPAKMEVTVSEPEGTNYDDLNEGLYTLEPCVTPPPELPLRQKLIGTWKLESYTAYPTPTSKIQRPTFPMTKNVTGFIMYTPDGYMSAQMLIPGQQSFKRGEGEDAQWSEAAKRFFAYSGPYYISNEGQGREEILRHTFQVCNLPGWIGDIQVRTHQFEEDGEVLVLGSEEPAEIKVCLALPTPAMPVFQPEHAFLLSLGSQANSTLSGR